MQLESGARLGEYEIVGAVGAGGMNAPSSRSATGNRDRRCRAGERSGDFTRNEAPVHLRRLDLATRKVTPVRDVTIAESDAGAAVILMTPDLRAYAYATFTTAGDLFQLQGAK